MKISHLVYLSLTLLLVACAKPPDSPISNQSATNTSGLPATWVDFGACSIQLTLAPNGYYSMGALNNFCTGGGESGTYTVTSNIISFKGVNATIPNGEATNYSCSYQLGSNQLILNCSNGLTTTYTRN